LNILLDTCVLAELRNPKGSAAVRSALARSLDESLYLSVLTVGEIAKGIALLAASKKKRELTAWLAGLEGLFADRIVPVDRETATIWGEVTARAARKAIVIPAVDGLLAATAMRHGMRLWTRNSRHFEATGVLLFDPWNAGTD
jgi:predicted nucleic acid-binding protein